MITLDTKGTVVIKTATTGHEGQADSWTVFPYFPSDPNLERFGPDDRNLIKSLKITDSEATGSTTLDKQAEAIARLVKNLGELNHPWVVVKEIHNVSDELTNLLEKEYGIRDITVEDERQTSRESKE